MTIVTGAPKPDYNILKLQFGQYVPVFENNDPLNTNKTRTIGPLTLLLCGQNQEDYQFLSLITGKRLVRHQWDALPIPQGAVNRVHEMAEAEGQEEISGFGPKFEWTPGEQINLNEENYSDNSLILVRA